MSMMKKCMYNDLHSLNIHVMLKVMFSSPAGPTVQLNIVPFPARISSCIHTRSFW